MEFEIGRLYSAHNAEMLKTGSKGYFGINVGAIKNLLGDKPRTLKTIDMDDFTFRPEDTGGWFPFFYLVEEPEEKEESKYRPYKSIREIVEDRLEIDNFIDGEELSEKDCIRLIRQNPWEFELKYKDKPRHFTRIDDIDLDNSEGEIFRIHGWWHSLGSLLYSCVWAADNSPCGIEEE